ASGREPGAGRRRRRRVAAGADRAQRSDRADLCLRARRRRKLVRSARRAARQNRGNGRAACRSGQAVTGGPFRVAAVQTVSGGDVAANLAAVEPLVANAADRGAKLVLLPEYFGIFGARASDKVAVREADGRGPQQDFLE